MPEEFIVRNLAREDVYFYDSILKGQGHIVFGLSVNLSSKTSKL
jgi:hypothetical protein